jgi:hypothetical protein
MVLELNAHTDLKKTGISIGAAGDQIHLYDITNIHI